MLELLNETHLVDLDVSQIKEIAESMSERDAAHLYVCLDFALHSPPRHITGASPMAAMTGARILNITYGIPIVNLCRPHDKEAVSEFWAFADRPKTRLDLSSIPGFEKHADADTPAVRDAAETERKILESLRSNGRANPARSRRLYQGKAKTAAPFEGWAEVPLVVSEKGIYGQIAVAGYAQGTAYGRNVQMVRDDTGEVVREMNTSSSGGSGSLRFEGDLPPGSYTIKVRSVTRPGDAYDATTGTMPTIIVPYLRKGSLDNPWTSVGDPMPEPLK